LTDHDFPDEEFAPIAAAMKELPYFAPSPHFADKVMAHVRIQGAANLPVAAQSRSVAAPGYIAPPVRRETYAVDRPDLRRSIPARFAATAIVATFGTAIAAVMLVTIFNIDLLVLISRVFGQGAVAFLAGLAADTSASVGATAASTTAAASTGAGVAVIGSFVAGAAVATAGLKAAASINRKAA
jgi:hypothetical protein